MGTLPLNISLGEFKRRCGELRDTIAVRDESADTAVVFSRPGLSVVGHLYALWSDDPKQTPYRVDSTRMISTWEVSGTRGRLPHGVSLAAPWDSMVRVYGDPYMSQIDGQVFVWFCKTLPEFVFFFPDRAYLEGRRDSLPGSMKGAQIESITFPARRAGDTTLEPACSHKIP